MNSAHVWQLKTSACEHGNRDHSAQDEAESFDYASASLDHWIPMEMVAQTARNLTEPPRRLCRAMGLRYAACKHGRLHTSPTSLQRTPLPKRLDTQTPRQTLRKTRPHCYSIHGAKKETNHPNAPRIQLDTQARTTQTNRQKTSARRYVALLRILSTSAHRPSSSTHRKGKEDRKTTVPAQRPCSTKRPRSKIANKQTDRQIDRQTDNLVRRMQRAVQHQSGWGLAPAATIIDCLATYL
ncbi:hypothetical protein IWX90DRAFT_100790 [Phyllosticta citrichinensis]|uniref:Uncharacterized protein n=1 Tax=Phyllosticta citrichinensis TaxID=1130410 RepID=A0ABR1Y2H3_9PEZI